MNLLPLHPRTIKSSLGSSFEWLESLHQDHATCLRFLSENYSVLKEGISGLGFPQKIDKIPFFIKRGPFEGVGVLQIKLLSAKLGPGPLTYGPRRSFKP